MARSRVRRRIIVASLALGARGAGAIVAREIWLNDTARVVDEHRAVERFRQSTAPVTEVTEVTEAAPLVASLPEPGVYRYTTTGFEHVDVFGGSTHQYPRTTTLTVTDDGCGVLLRWDLLQERREEWRLCVDDRGVVWQTSGAFYHEFFQHGQVDAMTCDRPVVLVPIDRRPREGVAESCLLAGSIWTPEWRVLEQGTRAVDGRDVRVIHVRMTVDIRTRYYERTTVDYWLDDHGLPLSIAATKISNSDSGLAGDVVYTESLTAELDSLSPLR